MWITWKMPWWQKHFQLTWLRIRVMEEWSVREKTHVKTLSLPDDKFNSFFFIVLLSNWFLWIVYLFDMQKILNSTLIWISMSFQQHHRILFSFLLGGGMLRFFTSISFAKDSIMTIKTTRIATQRCFYITFYLHTICIQIASWIASFQKKIFFFI